MRSALAFLASALVAASAPASAGVLTSATWTAQIPGLGPAVFSTSVPITATGSSTGGSIAVSLTLPAFAAGGFDPGAPVTTYRLLNLGGAQAIVAAPSMVTVTAGVPGSAKVMIAPGPMLPGIPAIAAPLSVGVSGVVSGSWFQIQPHYFTLDFYAWTAGTRTFTGLTRSNAGLPTPTVVAMGSFGLNPNGGGSVLLVAPTRLAVDSGLYKQRTVSLTALKLNFVPEPSTLLLLGAAGAMAALHRFRARWPVRLRRRR